MKSIKTFLAASAVFFLVLSGLSAQSGQGSGGEMSVEESYLQESVETMIIREQSRADDRDSKFVALEYIRESIEDGSAGEEARAALEYMGLEGVLNQTRENGRLVNNYPDIRVKAAEYLGDLGTAEARASLVRMLLVDNEPMVLTQVIRSLSKIDNAGTADEQAQDTLSSVAWIVRQWDVRMPTDLLALAGLEYFETYARINSGFKEPEAVMVIHRIESNNRYIRPVRDRAHNLMISLRRANAQSSGTASSGRTN